MGIRKRRSPAPSFRQPAPFSPISGEYAPIGKKRDKTRIAMFQVIEADTHDNYVVCRGFDPEAGVFLNSVAVAKPYHLRGAFTYSVAHMLPAAKPLTRIGETPGVSAVTMGCPADLTEVIDILLDDESNPIAWLDISGGTAALIISGVLDGGLSAGGSATMSIWELAAGTTDWVNDSADTGDNVTVYAPAVMRSGTIAAGTWVECMLDDYGCWRVRWSECP